MLRSLQHPHTTAAKVSQTSHKITLRVVGSLGAAWAAFDVIPNILYYYLSSEAIHRDDMEEISDLHIYLSSALAAIFFINSIAQYHIEKQNTDISHSCMLKGLKHTNNTLLSIAGAFGPIWAFAFDIPKHIVDKQNIKYKDNWLSTHIAISAILACFAALNATRYFYNELSEDSNLSLNNTKTICCENSKKLLNKLHVGTTDILGAGGAIWGPLIGIVSGYDESNFIQENDFYMWGVFSLSILMTINAIYNVMKPNPINNSKQASLLSPADPVIIPAGFFYYSELPDHQGSKQPPKSEDQANSNIQTKL